MDEHEWRVTGVLVAASVVAWFAADRYTDGSAVKWGVLLVGVVVLPRAYVEYRRVRGSSTETVADDDGTGALDATEAAALENPTEDATDNVTDDADR